MMLKYNSIPKYSQGSFENFTYLSGVRDLSTEVFDKETRIKSFQSMKKTTQLKKTINSKMTNANEILLFMENWDHSNPVIIVPTMYYQTPTEVYENCGISVVI